tara:strand:- start:118 stop:891 length:774 start_codon:yes stop_codon:yes gene_type:complete
MFVNERIILRGLKELSGWDESKCTNTETPKVVCELVQLLTFFKRHPNSCPRLPTLMNYYTGGSFFDETKGGKGGNVKNSGLAYTVCSYMLRVFHLAYPDTFRVYMPPPVEVSYGNTQLERAIEKCIAAFKQATCNGSHCNVGFVKIKLENAEHGLTYCPLADDEFFKTFSKYNLIYSFSVGLANNNAAKKHQRHVINGYVCRNETTPAVRICNSWQDGCLPPDEAYHEINDLGKYSYGQQEFHLYHATKINILLRRL